MSEEYKNRASWQRILFVVLFWIIFSIAQMVVAAIAVAQCLFVLFTAKPNEQLLSFGDSMGKYIHDILRYVTFNTDHQPFPFNDFPKPDLVIQPE